MKKRNIVIIVVCAVLCFAGVTVIFQRYQSWTDQTLDKLISQNLEAYTKSQTSEVVSKVEEVQVTLKTVAELMAKSEKEGIDPGQYKDFFKSISDNENIHVQEVAYYRFDTLNYEAMGEEDQAMLDQLMAGESVISNIYPADLENNLDTYYGIAEPVKVDGQCVGFMRGLISSSTLLHSNQTGFLRDNTESYLIHSNGTNALLDNFPKEQQIDMLAVLEGMCSDKKKIQTLRKAIKEGDQKILQVTLEGQSRYISFNRLPYNDLVILNISDPAELSAYTKTLEYNGRKMTLLLGALAVILALTAAIGYYMAGKKQIFERKRLALLVNFGDTILCEYDVKRDTFLCSSNITQLFDIDGTDISDFRSYLETSAFVCPEDLDSLEKMLSSHPKEDGVVSKEVRLKGRDGDYIWCRLDITGMANKKEDRLIIKVIDISKAKEKELGLLRKVQTDMLTGILSREAFAEKAKKRMAVSHRGYMVLLDLDNFKEINDIYGHALGDECLQRVGEVLGNTFRSEDLAGRYGGDEFFVFMSGEIAEEVLNHRMERLTEELASIRIEESPKIHITCSIGVAWCKEDDTYEKLVKRADEAMYVAKKQGKNSWIIQ